MIFPIPASDHNEADQNKRVEVWTLQLLGHSINQTNAS